jgi:hypothetical protein
MDGAPEGTGGRTGGSRPRWLVLVALLFAAYLTVRMVEGLVWIVQWMW